MPHLASGSYEAEDNCALMAAAEVKDFLENGNITNSVNYPECNAGVCSGAQRITVCYKVTAEATRRLAAEISDFADIHSMVQKTRGNYGYAIIDLASKVSDAELERIKKIEGVIRVRSL